MDEPRNTHELPIGRFLNSKLLGGNGVILAVRRIMHLQELDSYGRL